MMLTAMLLALAGRCPGRMELVEDPGGTGKSVMGGFLAALLRCHHAFVDASAFLNPEEFRKSSCEF